MFGAVINSRNIVSHISAHLCDIIIKYSLAVILKLTVIFTFSIHFTYMVSL